MSTERTEQQRPSRSGGIKINAHHAKRLSVMRGKVIAYCNFRRDPRWSKPYCAGMSVNHYRAISLERFATHFRAATDIVALPKCDPNEGEIAVRNLWCGVNGVFDTQIGRNAVDYVKIKPPALTGVEALGIIEAVGAGVENLIVGDAVATLRFGGGYREYNTGAAADFVKLPGAEREWLALASTGVSALLALDAGEAKAGETVAVSAAAGGLGHFIVQLAKLRGCKVVAVCGGEQKAALVRGLGADRVIDYRNENLHEVLATEFNDRIDVAIDTVSGEMFDAFLENLAVHGRLVVAGAAQDLDGRPEVVTAPRVVHKLYYKAASIRGFMNGLVSECWPEARRTLFDLYETGKLNVIFDENRFTGLEQVYDAVEHLLSGKSMGKVVVDLRR